MAFINRSGKYPWLNVRALDKRILELLGSKWSVGRYTRRTKNGLSKAREYRNEGYDSINFLALPTGIRVEVVLDWGRYRDSGIFSLDSSDEQTINIVRDLVNMTVNKALRNYKERQESLNLLSAEVNKPI